MKILSIIIFVFCFLLLIIYPGYYTLVASGLSFTNMILALGDYKIIRNNH